MLFFTTLLWCRHLSICCPPPLSLINATALRLRFFSVMGDSAEPKANSNTPPKDEAYLQSVIPKRISLFQSIQNQQNLQRLALSSGPIKISLRDGNVKEGSKWNTTPYDVAKDISKSLASNALIAKVDGVLWDMSRPLERDCKLELFDFDSDEGRDTFWHSSAHILDEVNIPSLHRNKL